MILWKHAFVIPFDVKIPTRSATRIPEDLECQRSEVVDQDGNHQKIGHQNGQRNHEVEVKERNLEKDRLDKSVCLSALTCLKITVPTDIRNETFVSHAETMNVKSVRLHGEFQPHFT